MLTSARVDVGFGLLGPVVAVDSAGRPLALGAPRRRALLAALLLHPRSAVPVVRLTELLWDGAAPPTAATMVHAAAAGLRRTLTVAGGSPPLVTRDGGYALDIHRDQLDAARFEELLAQGRRLVGPAPARASTLLAEALGLWRGPALDGVEQRFARDAARRWDELRLECREQRMAAELALGRHAAVVADLEDLVARHPFREPLCASLVLALYRCGRQADALERLRAHRRTLIEELGLEPGPRLRHLERAVLEHRAELEPAVPASAVVLAGTQPAPVDELVGRVRERAVVGALVRAHRLVTVTGPGGVGKTRLALEVARQLGEDGAEVRLVDLAALTTPALVSEAVGQALGIRAMAGRRLAGAVAAALAGQTVTLLLDSCEHLVDACADVIEPLLRAAAGLRVLATSRQALGVPGEHVYPLPPLSTDVATGCPEETPGCEAPGCEAPGCEAPGCDAMALFERRAAAARPGFAVTPANAELVLEVCRRLDGLPLALELAAARVASMPLPDLAARLDDRFRLLDSTVRTATVRHRSLAATLDWSLDLLGDAERMLFDRLSVFPATFTLAAAEQVASDGALARKDIGLLLGRLVAGSTVQLEDQPDGRPRYRLLESPRRYGWERLDDRVREELRARHARHQLWLAQQAEPHLLGPTSVPWLERLRAEHDNVRAALDWAFGPSGDSREGARLVACLWHPWDLRGARGEGLHWVITALDTVSPQFPEERLPLLAAGALFSLGGGDFDAVAELAGEQLALARATDHQGWAGDALRMHATVAWARGRMDRAQQLYEDAVAASLAAGDLWRAALAEAQSGRLHRDRDEPDAARALARRALAHAEEVGEPLALGLATDILGSVEQRWGRLDAARRLVADALDHYRRVGYLEGEASALQLAGRVALSAREVREAADAFGSSLRLCRRIGHLGGSAGALEGLAGVAAAECDDDRAMALLGAAEALRARIGNPLTGAARRQHQQIRAGLVERMGPAAADRALQRGAGLPPEELPDVWTRTAGD